MAEETRVGVYHTHLEAASISVEEKLLRVGDVIRIKDHTSDFIQVVESIQLERDLIQEPMPGQDVGIKVAELARAARRGS